MLNRSILVTDIMLWAIMHSKEKKHQTENSEQKLGTGIHSIVQLCVFMFKQKYN